MTTIQRKTQLSADVYRFDIEAPLIARERKPGQFVIIQMGDFEERIPLTIADADPKAGTISVIFQAVGQATKILAQCQEGDEIPHLLGPLGKATHLQKYGTVVCVGGGIGIAPLHPIAQGLKNVGNRLVVILGARTKDLLILEREMTAIADEIHLCTDDGSYGRKGLVTEPLKALCETEPKPGLVVAIGPPLMMRACAEATRPYGVHTIVSLNTIMVDGTGMCGGCRVTVGGKTLFTCVDGPEFDGHQVDFDNFLKRQAAYREQERCASNDCRLTRVEQGARA